ncbi:MAG: efflux RND transporter periplasmic adaptor subunit [Nannocystaceae bacterium]|nr:efflux RND transporter periplasmic adaptor subunit [Nannocystaceae bacterium]
MKRLRTILVPLVILVAGVMIARALVLAKPEPEHHPVEIPITYVDVLEARPADHTAIVRAMGVVRPEREVVLQPEVGGRVVELSPELVPGGRLRKGEQILKVDPRDYSAAVASVQAEMSQAALAVREEATLRRVAEHEWKDSKDVAADTLEFVMREPHLEAAQARVSSVRSRIDKARRDLQRTSLKAPFDAIVLDESIDVGQMVGPQTPVARLAGTERFWVQVALPVDELGMLEIPGVNVEGNRGSAAKILYGGVGSRGGDVTQSRDGYATKLAVAVEERGRLAQLYVAVEDPLGLRLPIATRGLPLLVGRYVEVELAGRLLSGVFELPRTALRDDTMVWVVDEQQRLQRREIHVAWREQAMVYVDRGLQRGDRVVTTPLATATEGMKVSIAEPLANAVASR